MDLRERKKKSRTERPRRSVVENFERREREKKQKRENDDDLIATLRSNFEQYVTEYVMFVADVQLKWDETQNPTFLRMRDELIAKLGTICRRHKRHVVIRSISFRPQNREDRATNVLAFNYKKRDQFIDVAALRSFADQLAPHPYSSLVGVCESEVNRSIVHIEDFHLQFDSYSTVKRREAFNRGRVYAGRVKGFAKVKWRRGMKGDGDCSVCLEEYDVGEELVKVPCGHLMHRKCVRRVLAQSCHCPICRKVLA